MPYKVTNVTINQISDFLFKLYFDQIAGSRTYNVYLNGDLFKQIDTNNSIVLAGSRIEYIVTGVNPEQIINLTIKTVINGTEGTASDPVVFMTEDNRVFTTESTTLLAGGATFTGNLHDASIYKQIKVLAYSDKAGTIKVQQSGDGVNWDIEATQAVAPSIGIVLSIDLATRYVRVLYTNGGVAQATDFRLFSTIQ